MKKLLSVLATVGFVASSAVSFIGCGTKKEDKNPNPEEPKENLNEIIKDFQK
ncbi:lipoprotein [Spiroplasma endosymbiont of Atherix ibis]|uniref:lipoprotein n=1 Tax=Spiroplasma endosymbiont of Atherix ibis TaxID=3066291 RepID=UPI0030CB633D